MRAIVTLLVPILLVGVARADIVCADNESSCRDGSTCCPLADGSYGCCPLSGSATCCADNVHCCPSGLTCDLNAMSCVPQAGSGQPQVPLLRKLPSTRMDNRSLTAGGSCDDSSCPGSRPGTHGTCCPMVDVGPHGPGFGCCPYEAATCCGGICCKVHQRCESPGVCRWNGQLVEASARIVPSSAPKVVACPGGTSSCQDGQTCCQLADGSYGCCPQANATCCDDHEHCCPSGYDCDLSQGSCVRKSLSLIHARPFALEKAEKTAKREGLAPDEHDDLRTAPGDPR